MPDPLRQPASGEEAIMAAEEELEGGDDSLGSLKDLDLLDVGAMGDKGLQDIIKDNEDIIKEVMNEQDGNEENVPPPVTVNIKKMEPKVVIQFLAPKKKSPQKKRPGPGRPRKNKVNILKQSKTTANKKSSPPQNSESELRVRTDMLDGPHKLPPPMRVQLTEAQIVDILQDATGIPTSVIQTSLPPPVIEDPPTVDKPRQFPELDAAEAAYIGDMDRAWRVMEELGMRETQDKQLQLQYLKRQHQNGASCIMWKKNMLFEAKSNLVFCSKHIFFLQYYSISLHNA